MRTPLLSVLLASAVLAAGAVTLSAQSLRVAGGFGPVIPVGEFEEGRNRLRVPIAASHSLRIEWGWPVAGPRPGEYEAGVGLLSIDFPATEELGRPVTVYGFSHMPLGGAGGTRFRFDAAVGVSIGWRAFHPVDNRYQLSIGAPVSAFFQAEMSAVHALGPDLDAIASVGYRHFSVGNLALPNDGLNTIPVSIGLRARPAGFGSAVQTAQTTLRRAATLVSHEGWSLLLQPFVGARTFAGDLRHLDGDTSYVQQRLPVAGLHLRTDRPLNGTLSVAALASATWDAGAFRASEVPSLESRGIDGLPAFSFGLGASLIVDTGVASIEAGLGYSALDAGARRGVPRFHQRLGVHVPISDRVHPFVVLRALSFERPDFLEWGVAFRVF